MTTEKLSSKPYSYIYKYTFYNWKYVYYNNDIGM